MKNILLLAFGLWVAPFYRSQAITVQITSDLFATCGGYEGSVQAIVSGGTGPYFYVWYVDQQTYGYGQYLTFEADGTFYGGAIEVFVTDGGMEQTQAILNMPGILPAQIDQIWHPDYSAGSPALIGFSSWNMMPTSAGGGPGLVSSGLVGSTGYAAFSGAPGSLVGVTLQSSDCGATADTWIHPPSILPEIGVVDLSGSCSTASTGSVLFSVVDGNTSDGLWVHLRGPNGVVSTSQLIYSIPSTVPFNGIPAGTYWAVITGLGVSLPGLPYTHKDSIQITIPDLGECGLVQGQAFVDNNLNCTKQISEPAVPSLILMILPGPYYTTTNTNGNYSQHLPAGSYTIQQINDHVGAHCVLEPVAFSVTSGSPTVINFADTASVPLDVGIAMASGPARPGFILQYAIDISNLTPLNSGPTTVTMVFDPILQFQNSIPAQTNLSGTALTWQQPTLSAWQEQSIIVNFLIPADVSLIGTDLVSNATVSTVNTDADLDNNAVTHISTITGAYDPNDKLAWTSNGSSISFDPAEDQWIDYAIRFQNTGTDTAFHVIITDTLENTLDPGSIQIGAGSHPFTWQLRDQGTVKVNFLNIQLPDSNINEPASHGFVSFRIKPRDPQDLLPGDQIINTANIYFDFNPPVITDPSVLVVPQPGVQLNVKAILGGAYDQATGLMRDALRAEGLLPIQEPYTAMGYDHTTGGGETMHGTVTTITGTDAVVDWVVMELRNAAQPAIVVASRSVLLQRDGDLVTSGSASPLTFPVADGNYHVALYHRNHLAVMTATPITLSTATTAVVDLTDPATSTWGTNARQNINGIMVLWPGDVNFDGTIKYTGLENDRDPILVGIGGTVPTNTVSDVYDPKDVNLDGVIKYTGTGNDRDIILQTIGGTVPTAMRVGQVP